MPSNSHLTHLPLQAMRQSLVNIATGLRAGGQNGASLDILALQPIAVCSNALSMLREASPFLESALLTVGPFAVLAYGVYRYVWNPMNLHTLFNKLASHFVAKITVPGSHQLNQQIVDWLSKNNVGTDTKSLTLHGNGLVKHSSSIDDWDQKTADSLSYIPAVGSSSFRFNGYKLSLQRSDSTQVQIYDHFGKEVKGHSKTKDSDITISCLSLFGGPEPIKSFLEFVRKTNEQQTEAMTTFYRIHKQILRGAAWDMGVRRLARGLDAITMEDDKKSGLVNDIATYLSPESKAWYVKRGIPWRRGYLFYGPPGTGKTSFCSALAGHFDLNVFIISLSSPALTDDHLEDLFDELPPKCLVLLEDVDSAGIVRETMNAPTSGEQKPVKKLQQEKKGVTLSGLLNVIDGPCSHEGRLLILTSNSPDTLDAALIRPGRIDRKVLFGNASSEVIGKLFMHIFTDNPACASIGLADLTTMSQKFAASIAEDKLTPAEIQNFLLENRGDPAEAVKAVKSWADGVIATKALGKNVATFTGQIGSETDKAAEGDKPSEPAATAVPEKTADSDAIAGADDDSQCDASDLSDADSNDGPFNGSGSESDSNDDSEGDGSDA